MKSSSASLNAADTLLAFNRDTFKKIQEIISVILRVIEDLNLTQPNAIGVKEVFTVFLFLSPALFGALFTFRLVFDSQDYRKLKTNSIATQWVNRRLTLHYNGHASEGIIDSIAN